MDQEQEEWGAKTDHATKALEEKVRHEESEKRQKDAADFAEREHKEKVRRDAAERALLEREH